MGVGRERDGWMGEWWLREGVRRWSAHGAGGASLPSAPCPLSQPCSATARAQGRTSEHAQARPREPDGNARAQGAWKQSGPHDDTLSSVVSLF